MTTTIAIELGRDTRRSRLVLGHRSEREAGTHVVRVWGAIKRNTQQIIIINKPRIPHGTGRFT